MHKAGIFLLLMGLCWFSGQGPLLYAQEEYREEIIEEEERQLLNEGTSLETDWRGYVAELYSRGDQTFTISLGVNIPAGLYESKMKKVANHNWSPAGGTGSLAYTRFLSSHFFLGGEVGVNFNFTRGKSTIFIIPIGLRVGWQFLFRRFEFPLTFVIGIAPERYINFSYVGLFIKLGGPRFSALALTGRLD